MDKRDKERVMPIEIYTDGSLKKTGKITFGGWAFVAVKDSKEIYYAAGSENGSTNQRMELTAIIKAIEYARSIRRNSEKVIIYSDSAYVVNCYLKNWYIGWQYNGWLNASGKDVANKDLWLEIIPYFDNFWYDFSKVPAHSGVLWNERCDELAQNQAENLKRNWRGIKNYD